MRISSPTGKKQLEAHEVKAFDKVKCCLVISGTQKANAAIGALNTALDEFALPKPRESKSEKEPQPPK